MSSAPTPADVAIRPVVPGDLDVFFRIFSDPESVTMAGFTAEDPNDREAFDDHWAAVLASEAVTARTVLWQGAVVGHVASFEVDGVTEVTYWVDQAVWGQGIATAALAQLLAHVTTRPVFARAAADNAASLRVLGKCGFRPVRTERAYANARGEETDETILRLD
ncbi:RimJ/RimL family protein N-acetyltransferase [Friedmanniella endophytica]|uniref:RimJ/RimL family protein N-acetyltransferase n=1 Tax=Microlunatus kandeliicorticis TaxID=1759536 RepID=A0A7W3ISJ5_9ACTN|nr:GNAT family N-acetyltransferase [Microlunatus kandeliicorticis]MBA8794395.1 RimJ/RimL family protein N-acetyltransferase [Microlunatus kandeliicorticis]